MARIDHVAFETDDPDHLAEFYDRILDARIVKTEGHPVMAYLGDTGLALHEQGGPGGHTAVRVSEEERAGIRRRLEKGGRRGAGARPSASPSASSSRIPTAA